MAAVVFGLASTIFPDHPGATGRAWGTGAVVGGVLFIAVAEWEWRQIGRRTNASSISSATRGV